MAADLVGRTIGAGGRGGGRGVASSMRSSNNNNNNNSRQMMRGASDIGGGGGVSDDVSALYNLVESAMFNMPQPDPTTNELRPAELGRMREMLQQTWDGIREWLAAHLNANDRQMSAMHQG